MQLTADQERILTTALGERAVKIITGVEHAGRGPSIELSGLNLAELPDAINGVIIGIGMSMADAQHMFERMGVLMNELVRRERGEVPSDPAIEPAPVRQCAKLTRISRKAWPVYDSETGETHATLAAAALAVGREQRLIRISCYQQRGRFRWVDVPAGGGDARKAV